MEHVVPHTLDIPTAKLAADKAYESYRERFAEYNPTATWTSDTHCDVAFTVKKITVEASLDLQPGKIVMGMEVPLLFRPFKKLALGYVKDEVEKWISKAERGELEGQEAPAE
ncbi:MAG: polyhydroxyalkanoic acid system family protein [Myxococcota bacterium]